MGNHRPVLNCSDSQWKVQEIYWLSKLCFQASPSHLKSSYHYHGVPFKISFKISLISLQHIFSPLYVSSCINLILLTYINFIYYWLLCCRHYCAAQFNQGSPFRYINVFYIIDINLERNVPHISIPYNHTSAKHL